MKLNLTLSLAVLTWAFYAGVVGGLFYVVWHVVLVRRFGLPDLSLPECWLVGLWLGLVAAPPRVSTRED